MLFFPLHIMLALLVGLSRIPAILACNTSSYPTDFKFGAGSSAYQIEGAYNEDGKGPSFYDWLFNSLNLSNGNVATDSYHKYRDDVAAIKEIGLDFYRFSISWSRILPTGFSNEVNQAGVDYYNNLLDELEQAGIEPLVTIFHLDTPLSFSYMGDWSNPQIIDRFLEYAELIFQLFGDRVKLWATINEPIGFCRWLPTLLQPVIYPAIPLGIYEYQCGRNVLLAHAKVYRLYQRKYKWAQKGRIGLVLNVNENIPKTNSSEDQEAVERANALEYGWFANPLVYGDYPEIMKDIIASNSRQQNFSQSRLPEFTISERLLIKGAYDVFMLNTYSAQYVTTAPYNNTPSAEHDVQIETSSGNFTYILPGFAPHPPSVRRVLGYIKNTFRNPEIMITENGYVNLGGRNDTERTEYIRGVLQQIRLAVCEDGVKITRYTYWSLLDSFEWNSGYRAKFGLVEVDFNSTDLTRTLKESAYFYKNVIETRSISGESV